jgi:hypothetical protein
MGWLCNKKYGVVNMLSSAVCCWGLWKLKKNSLCFDDVVSKYEDTLAKGGVNVEMLKSFGA